MKWIERVARWLVSALGALFAVGFAVALWKWTDDPWVGFLFLLGATFQHFNDYLLVRSKEWRA